MGLNVATAPPPADVTPELSSSRRRAAHRLACWREVLILSREIAELSTTAGRAAATLSTAADLDDTTGDAVAEVRSAQDIDDLVERLRHMVNGARLTQSAARR